MQLFLVRNTALNRLPSRDAVPFTLSTGYQTHRKLGTIFPTATGKGCRVSTQGLFLEQNAFKLRIFSFYLIYYSDT